MPNFYAEFRKILAPSQQLVGEVVAYQDGIATVMLPGGDQCRAKGQTQVGAKVFIQDEKIIGPAPDLPVTISEI
ncbi:hypothetical protein G7047_19200 [Diaphorobacter sp. HDW4A]|uniref:hypothetical protein n=1 Tax=Diaphorobacter sp. HDW4A TaxID=2714924 RepID=UPI00140A13BF|nr:hypothetical protein [Diaphorobacter sp. HDW4A]QIL81805.1 hypothetical protein G7047_19200 [Diaphorobacter sp. HDW4A]